MSADHGRDEIPEDDEHTRIVVRGSGEESTRVVHRATDEHTRVVQRTGATALPPAVDAADEETRLVPRTAGAPASGQARVSAPVSPTAPDRFRPPSVASGSIDSYRAHRVPTAAAPPDRLHVEPAPTVVLTASPAQIRAAATARMRRRRWLTLAVAVISTILVAAAAITAIVALAGS